MTYRGLDLDLRTPAARGAARREQAPGSEGFGNLSRWEREAGARSEPLWVDETVLACCNHAYDLALAHGAPTVRLDHLLHAMTRVDAAAQALERRGLREAQLRRESSALIASEAPLAIGAERGSPRRSDDLEDVLVHAVALADRRGEAAGVDDVVNVMLNYARELPAIALLRSAAPDWSRAEWARLRDRNGLRPERPRSEPRLEPVLVHSPPDPRIDTVDSALRAIRLELASDRKALADLLRDAHRDTNERLVHLERIIDARVADTHAVPHAIVSRVEAIESGLEGRIDELRRLWSLTGERVDTIQTSLDERLARPFGVLGERIAGIEVAVNQPRGPDPETVQLVERVQTLERAVHAGMAEGARNWAGLGQRLQAFESTHDRLASIEGALRGIDTAGGVNQLWTAIAQRLQTVERMIETRASEHASQARVLADRLKTLEDMVAAQRAEAGETRAAFAVGLKTLESNGGIGQADAATLQRALDERVASLRGAIDQAIGPRQAELQQRLAALETSLGAVDRTGKERHEATLADLMDMQEALVRLADNQQALSSSLKDWRLDTQGDLSIINNQLAQLIALPRAAAAAAAATAAPAVPPAAPAAPVAPPPAAAASAASPAARINGGPREAIVSVQPSAKAQPVPPPIQPAPGGATVGVRPAAEARGAAVPGGAIGHNAGFWWWLFGTNQVRQANRGANVGWQRMRERMSSRDERT